MALAATYVAAPAVRSRTLRPARRGHGPEPDPVRPLRDGSHLGGRLVRTCLPDARHVHRPDRRSARVASPSPATENRHHHRHRRTGRDRLHRRLGLPVAPIPTGRWTVRRYTYTSAGTYQVQVRNPSVGYYATVWVTVPTTGAAGPFTATATTTKVDSDGVPSVTADPFAVYHMTDLPDRRLLVPCRGDGPGPGWKPVRAEPWSR